jgi:hypothetical protein
MAMMPRLHSNNRIGGVCTSWLRWYYLGVEEYFAVAGGGSEAGGIDDEKRGKELIQLYV